MRRIWAIVLAAVMLFTLVACAPSDTEQTSSDSGIAASDSSEASGETSDGSTPAEGALTTTAGRSRTTVTTTTTTAKTTAKTTADGRPSTTTRSTAAAPTKTATTTAAPTKDQKIIVCWGASTTQGMGMTYASGNKYPDQLQKILGDDYFVWNGGYGGDSSTAVATRQGAYTLKTKNDITFADGVSTVTIGHRVDGMGLLLEDGTEFTHMNINQSVSPTASWERMLDFNPVTINGSEYTLGRTYEGMPEPYQDGYYYVTLTRASSKGTQTIPAGSTVTLSGIDVSDKAYCEIYYLVGVNGVTDPTSDQSIALLVRRIRDMIDHHGHDNYLVVIPQWSSKFDAAYEEAFGERAVNLRELACERGLEVEGLTPTVTDKSLIAGGEVPASLRYQNKSTEVHLNKYGYHFLATVLYERGQKLGYWE